MEKIQSLIKYVRISPKKMIEIARSIQGQKVNNAIDCLKLIPRNAARHIVKALESAVSNAESKNLISKNLIIYRALIEQGPSFKRFHPVARGSAHSYKKRLSHIRIILTEKQI
jgi:large subunit ribosomal protein L22